MEKRKYSIEELNRKAQRKGFIIQTTPKGLQLLPVIRGHPFTEEQLSTLSLKDQSKIRENRRRLETELGLEFSHGLNQDRDMEEVECKYCGTLYSNALSECPHCGAFKTRGK